MQQVGFEWVPDEIIHPNRKISPEVKPIAALRLKLASFTSFKAVSLFLIKFLQLIYST